MEKQLIIEVYLFFSLPRIIFKCQKAEGMKLSWEKLAIESCSKTLRYQLFLYVSFTPLIIVVMKPQDQ